MNSSNIPITNNIEISNREEWSQFHKRHASTAVSIPDAEELERQRKLRECLSLKRIFRCFFRPFSASKKRRINNNRNVKFSSNSYDVRHNNLDGENSSYSSEFGINLNAPPLPTTGITFPSSKPIFIRSPSFQFLDLQQKIKTLFYKICLMSFLTKEAFKMFIHMPLG